MRSKDITVNAIMSNNNNYFIIYYNLYDSDSNKNESTYRVNISINKNGKMFDMEKFTDTEFEKELIALGCTKEEIEKFINIKKFNAVNLQNLNYKLYKGKELYSAEKTLDRIIEGEDCTLTEVQKKLLQDENAFTKTITTDEYINLPDSYKQLYERIEPNKSNTNDVILFLHEFIKNHNNSIATMLIQSRLKIKDINSCVKMNIENSVIDNSYKVKIEKSYISTSTPIIRVDGAPLIKINPETKYIFKDFDEDRFTSNLKPDILHNLYNNLTAVYTFRQTAETQNKVDRLKAVAKKRILNDTPIAFSPKELELVRSPKTITSEDSTPPDGYELTSIESQKLTSEYEQQLADVTSKPVHADDLLYLIDFLLNI